MATSVKKTLTMSEIIESHKPKNYKYKFLINNDDVYKELNEQQFDLDTLDTIRNDGLVQEALKTEYIEYQREVVAKAKEPTILDNGVILSKKMVTKADKKLLGVFVGFFDYNYLHYISIKLKYEKFEILEIFILT